MKIVLTWTKRSLPAPVPLANSALKCPLESWNVRLPFGRNISFSKTYYDQSESWSCCLTGQVFVPIGHLATYDHILLQIREHMTQLFKYCGVFKVNIFLLVFLFSFWRLCKASTSVQENSLNQATTLENSTYFAGDRIWSRKLRGAEEQCNSKVYALLWQWAGSKVLFNEEDGVSVVLSVKHQVRLHKKRIKSGVSAKQSYCERGPVGHGHLKLLDFKFYSRGFTVQTSSSVLCMCRDKLTSELRFRVGFRVGFSS